MESIFTDGFERASWHHRVWVYDAQTHDLKGGTYCELGNMFIPEGWEFGFLHGRPVAEDPSNGDGWAQAEARFSEGFPDRLHKGLRSYMWFGFYRSTDSWLFRQFTVEKGDRLFASVWAHGWSSNEDNPDVSDGVGDGAFVATVGTPGLSDAARNQSFVIGLDPTGGTDVFADTLVWGTPKHIYNAFSQVSVGAVAAGEKVTVFLRGRNLWRLKHNDYYWDEFELRWGKAEPVPSVDPRVPYDRVYALVCQDATTEEWMQVAAVADAHRWTVGRSHDDAGHGPGCASRTVYLAWFSKDTWDRPEQEAFFNQHYPGVILRDLYFYSDDEDTPAPPPKPPTPPSPPLTLLSQNGIGLHSQFPKALWDVYTAEGKARTVKVFSAGQAYEAKRFAPGCKVIWRKYVGNDGAWLDGDRASRARDLLALYLAELGTAARNLGVPAADLIDGVVIESLNEVVPSGSEETGWVHPNVAKAVEFDLIFADLVHREFGGKVGAGLLTVAVGNPGRHEVELLLPVAKNCHEHPLDLIGYHAYWPSNRVDAKLRKGDDLALVKTWPYYAGRWAEWDKVFTGAGYFPRYYFGECGICYAENLRDMYWGQGWKSCGSFEDYLFQLGVFNLLVNVWNKTHGNRVYGGEVFTYGGWDWGDFDFNEGDLRLLLNWAKGVL